MLLKDYFHEVHGYRLRYPDLPGLLVVKKFDGKNAEEVIPFELLEVSEGQLYKKKLDPSLVKAVQDITTSSPDGRKRTIESCLKVRTRLDISLFD